MIELLQPHSIEKKSNKFEYGFLKFKSAMSRVRGKKINGFGSEEEFREFIEKSEQI